jgi:hypothetical protein
LDAWRFRSRAPAASGLAAIVANPTGPYLMASILVRLADAPGARGER